MGRDSDLHSADADYPMDFLLLEVVRLLQGVVLLLLDFQEIVDDDGWHAHGVVETLMPLYQPSCLYVLACECCLECSAFQEVETASCLLVLPHLLPLPNPAARKHFLQIPGYFPETRSQLSSDVVANPAIAEERLLLLMLLAECRDKLQEGD